MATGGAPRRSDVESDQSAHTPDDQAPNFNLTGAAIKQETIETEVRVAQAVEPEIALEAQYELDELQKKNEAQELEAEQAKKAQEARLPSDVRKQQQILQDAKDKLRKGESEEEHTQRLANEEKLRLQVLKRAPQVEGILAHEAVDAITPKLPTIQANATASNQERDEAVAKEQAQAELDRKQNEVHAQELRDKLKKAQAQAELERTQFMQSPSKPVITTGAQGKKIQEIQAKLTAGQTQIEAAISPEKPVIGKEKVSALVTAFNTAKEPPVQAPGPRRSPRIKAQVEKIEAQQAKVKADAAKTRSVKAKR